MKKIKQLVECPYDIEIYGITDDSRNVKNGYLFVATRGYYVDHYDYIEDAITRGAVCVIADRTVDACVPVIIVDDINNYYIDLCERFYDVHSDEFNFIGITGTDGKTTTTTVLKYLLDDVLDIGCIGTNGLLIKDEWFSTNNTTPCVSELYNDLKLIKDRNCSNVVMEVSSEALLHDRLKRFKYDIVAFTNITEDHLNVHKTIENYRKCKFKLLDLVSEKGIVVVNGDDEICRTISATNLYTIGLDLSNNFVISNVNENLDNVNFDITYNNKKYRIISPLLGLYNVYNVTMAFAICLLKGINSGCLIDRIKNLSVVKGRREYLKFGQNYDIILDYAHTYNGIKCLFDSLSNYKRIITVTGAAGGREKEKRSKIGRLILGRSDISIFTMDDPRYEDVNDIIDQMVGDSQIDYLRIIDRKEAIIKAFELADEDSVVLVLGKGRDSYMAIEDRKEYYSDYDVIVNYFNC